MLWEATSVLSYLLIGYYHARSASRRAALQALLVTTLGGLVMLIGVVLVVVQADTSSLSAILADPPTGTVVDIAVLLLLVGALSKSAIFPFHFWLPGAMAAPTPVSAYLHAAAMVKAGIYLIARLAPGFAETPFWRPTLIALGVFTMLLGGFQALRERDLKRILAFGTVSQLGFLTVMLGYGTRDAALAGVALLLSHALFKSCLFLIVGVIDRQLNTRDIGQLSGLARQAPVMTTASVIAIASMAGVIPTLGFVAKETALTALLHEAEAGAGWGIVALVGIVLGSALTAGYGIRFLWGAYGTKRGVETTDWPDPPIGFLSAPVLLAAASLALGFLSPVVDHWLAPYADGLPASTPGVAAPDYPYHLACGTVSSLRCSSRSARWPSARPCSGSCARRSCTRAGGSCRSPRTTPTTSRCARSTTRPSGSPPASSAVRCLSTSGRSSSCSSSPRAPHCWPRTNGALSSTRGSPRRS